jgi:mannose-6-phosphate isomerase-like protein (cupin superfamily)
MLLQLDEGETITDRERRELRILLARPELTVTWTRHAPGEPGTSLHIHREHVDAFYVLAGELSFDVGPGPERITLGPGGFVAVPPGVVHSFVNAGSEEVRWLNFHAPDSGFASYLRNDSEFDNLDPPADGGRPVSELVVSRELPVAVPPYLWLAEGDDAPFTVPLDDGRSLAVRAG